MSKGAPSRGRASMEVTEEWATAIGWCAIHFGDIEHFVQTIIENLASEKLAESIKKLYLSERLKVLDGLLQSVGLTETESEHWSAIYRKLEKLKKDYRNPLAHGAPLPFIFLTQENQIVTGVHHVTHRNPQKDLTLAQVQSAAKEARAAHEKFQETLLQILVRLQREERIPILK
jgi:hypothetical protein